MRHNVEFSIESNQDDYDSTQRRLRHRNLNNILLCSVLLIVQKRFIKLWNWFCELPQQNLRIICANVTNSPKITVNSVRVNSDNISLLSATATHKLNCNLLLLLLLRLPTKIDRRPTWPVSFYSLMTRHVKIENNRRTNDDHKIEDS